jgi:class 3 adenylate cyclase
VFRFFTRFFPTIFLVSLAVSHLHSQTLADSIARILASAPMDTHRVGLLYDYAWEITESNPDKAEIKLKEAIGLAQRLGYQAGEANAWNGLGGVEETRGNWMKAIDCYQKTLGLRQASGDDKGVAKAFSNLGKAYESLGIFDSALVKQRENLRICEQLNDSVGAGRAHYRLGHVLQTMGLYLEAYDHVNQSRLVVEDRRDTAGMARVYTLLGHIRFELEMMGEARNWYGKALVLLERLGDSTTLADALSDMGNVLDELDTSRTGLAIPIYMHALNIRKELSDQLGMAEIYNNLGSAYKHLHQYKLAQESVEKSIQIRMALNDRPGIMESYNTLGDVLYGQKKYKDALVYVWKYFAIANEIKDEKYQQKGYKDLSKDYAALGDFKKAYEYQVSYDSLRYKRLSENRARDFERKEVYFSEGKRQKEIEKQQQELAHNRVVRTALIGGALALILLVGLLFNRNRIRARANQELASKNEEIARESERADKLLKNILPEKAANELKMFDKVLPVRYESVTVLFTDFKSFTKIAELVDPEELISELDECFRLFDAIISVFGLEKIKTIGDSYMCAGGLPTPNDTHPVDMVKAAIEMQHGLQSLMESKKEAGKKAIFEMRIGIHTGPVIAGVVGSHKFAYDIWGDTVNTAARMEQGSEPNKINISAATYELVRHRFECTYRGKMAAKNKGEIDMYFVDYIPISGSPKS